MILYIKEADPELILTHTGASMDKNNVITRVSQGDRYFYENHHFYGEYSINAIWNDLPERFPMHWHTVGEIICALKDHQIFCVQGREYVLDEGDILFIWPGELHAIMQAEADSYVILQYYHDLLDKFADLSILKNHVLNHHLIRANASLSPSGRIISHIRDIQELFHSSVLPMNNTRMCLSLYHILLEFYDFCCEKDPSPDIPAENLNLTTLQSITTACCYISENCEQALSLDKVAHHVGISKFYFSRLFKEYTQMNFNEYLVHQRISRSITLFEDPDISIAEVAFQSGFGSIASFNRRFRQVKNCTPSEYRAMLNQPEKGLPQQ